MTPMTLPASLPRSHMHTRQFTYECFERKDGLWDIDAEVRDVKDYAYQLHSHLAPAHVPMHKMQLRLTVDEGLTIRDIAAETLHAPFPQCVKACDPMQSMIGVKIGPGWRSEVERRLGGVKGCTHLRDLLLNAATAAIQSVGAHADHLKRLKQNPTTHTVMPHFVDKCMSWARDGEAIRRYEPAFYIAPAATTEPGS
jgi:hypothetical protein